MSGRQEERGRRKEGKDEGRGRKGKEGKESKARGKARQIKKKDKRQARIRSERAQCNWLCVVSTCSACASLIERGGVRARQEE